MGLSTAITYPSSVTDNNTGGIGTVAWTNPGNAKALDQTYATLAVGVGGTNTHYLWAQGYGFNIPTGATITGIVVSVTAHGSAGNTNVNAVQLIGSANTLVGTAKGVGPVWLTSDSTVNFGGQNDLWGQLAAGISPATVNSANFGVAVSLEAQSSITISVDAISITVYYFTNTASAFPGTGTNVSVNSDATWTNPGNIGATDGSYATASLAGNKSSPSTSNYLEATNFGFNLPSNAVIEGVQVIIDRFSAASTVQDTLVSLIVGGSLQGSGYQSFGPAWPASLTPQAYPYGSGDTWGVALTPAQVNASNFGVALQCQNITSSACTPSVDSIKVNVFYGLGAGTTRVVSSVAAMLLGNWN